jgi:hypothetical protein
MNFSDLRYAKHELHQNDLNLVIVKNGTIVFETRSPGIGGFLLAIENVGTELVDSSVADRIVGRAAAFLCTYAEIASVFAVTMSTEGLEVLRKNEIHYEYKQLVPHILNSAQTAICPFEELTSGLMDPKEAYLKLKNEVGYLKSEGS